MERKTIGGFIAVLRKANGYTQKELAEKLNVSDKSVSRWERDEGTPDLSLIPVIAEIFGVTSDELLRGERKAAQREDDTAAVKTTVKTEKQRQRLLSSMRSAYQTRSFLAIGLGGLGLIAAMIANLGFNRAYIGFLRGAMFFLMAIISQAIFINKAFLAVADDDVQGAEVEAYKRAVVNLGMKIITAVVTLVAFCLPLILVPTDAYAGVSGVSWFAGGAICSVIGLALCAVFCYFLTASLLKKGTYVLSEKQMAAYRQNFKLKRSCGLALAAILLVTIFCNAAVTGFWDALSIMEGTSFDDWDSFKAYMEQDIPATYNSGSGSVEEITSYPVDGTYYDENGNEITRDEAMQRTVQDSDGTVLCEYQDLNKSVTSFRYGHANGEMLPVTVYTMQELYEGSERIQVINSVFVAIYLVEAAAVIFFYLKKRAR